MQHRALSFLFALSVIAAALSGCGVPPPSGGAETFSTSSDSSSAFTSTIGLNIEATPSMITDDNVSSSLELEQLLFDALTPRKAYAFRGLNETTSISASSISVVALGPNISDPYRTAVPEHSVEKLSAGGYIIKFRDKLSPQLNLVIRVKLPNGRFFYGPLYETGDTENAILSPIDINIGTTYVITKLFEAIDSAAELDKHLPCSNSNIDCKTQHQTKVQLLKNIATTSAFYEIEFDNSLDFSESMALLETNTGFTRIVDIAIQEIIRNESPIAKGVRRSSFPLDATPWNREYNSTYFGVSINNYRPENGANEVILSSASSDIVPEGDLKNDNGDGVNTLPLYPRLVTSTDVREIRRDAAIPHLPFTRTPLFISRSGNYSLQDEESIQFYSSSVQNSDIDNQEQAASVFSRFVSTEGNLLLDRDIPQQIPGGQSGFEKLGWNYDPIYSRLFQANNVEPSFELNTNNEEIDYLSSPTWLTAAYYGRGKAFSLDEISNGEFSIDEEWESVNVYSWEIHGQETDESFDTDDIQGKTFGVISYAINLNDSDPVIEVSGETFKWSASNGIMNQTQPDDHYQTRTLERVASGGVSEPTPVSSNGTITRSFYTIETEEVTQENPSGISTVQGLLGLDGGSRAPLGHSSQNGKHLAFSLDTRNEGRGLILATELRNSTSIFREDNSPYRYKLQGNAIEIKNVDINVDGDTVNVNTNTFRNLTDSELLISHSDTADCTASISLTYLKTTHDYFENSVTSSRDTDDIENGLAPSLLAATSADCRIFRGEIEITFAQLLQNGHPLTLKGFITHSPDEDNTPGNLINLLWIQPGSLGLVFAQRDLELAPEFETVSPDDE